MKKQILVVGPSIPQKLLSRSDCILIHHPLIRLTPLPLSKSDLLFAAKSYNLIISSKQAALFLQKAFKENELPLQCRRIFCVGKISATSSRTFFPKAEIFTASEETQEGLASLIIQHRPTSITWPRSTKARPFLAKRLHGEGIDLHEISLYEPQQLEAPPSLKNINEVFFSSPSSVDAFFSLFTAQEVCCLKLSSIGPITQEQLEQKRSFA